MLLHEIFPMVGDSQTVKVYDAFFTNLLAEYDGRNSIPNELNDAVIEEIHATGTNELSIVCTIWR